LREKRNGDDKTNVGKEKEKEMEEEVVIVGKVAEGIEMDVEEEERRIEDGCSSVPRSVESGKRSKKERGGRESERKRAAEERKRVTEEKKHIAQMKRKAVEEKKKEKEAETVADHKADVDVMTEGVPMTMPFSVDPVYLLKGHGEKVSETVQRSVHLRLLKKRNRVKKVNEILHGKPINTIPPNVSTSACSSTSCASSLLGPAAASSSSSTAVGERGKRSTRFYEGLQIDSDDDAVILDEAISEFGREAAEEKEKERKKMKRETRKNRKSLSDSDEDQTDLSTRHKAGFEHVRALSTFIPPSSLSSTLTSSSSSSGCSLPSTSSSSSSSASLTSNSTLARFRRKLPSVSSSSSTSSPPSSTSSSYATSENYDERSPQGISNSIIHHLVGTDYRTMALTALKHLLPLLYPSLTQEDWDDVVECLELWWDTDPSSAGFPLGEEWQKGSQHYWECIKNSIEFKDTSFEILADISLGLYLCSFSCYL
jgi:hypothetical protein